jgi:hypothetical protein
LKSVEDMSGEKFELMKWLKGGSRNQFYEHLSFLMIVVAAVLIGAGVLLGSYVRYTVYIGVFGALLLLPAIMLYIASQLMEVKHETASA